MTVEKQAREKRRDVRQVHFFWVGFSCLNCVSAVVVLSLLGECVFFQPHMKYLAWNVALLTKVLVRMLPCLQQFKDIVVLDSVVFFLILTLIFLLQPRLLYGYNLRVKMKTFMPLNCPHPVTVHCILYCMMKIICQ